MDDEYISRSALVTALLWGVTGFFVAAAWMSWLLTDPGGERRLAPMLLLSGSIVGGITVVHHMRVYTKRICSLIRVSSGLDRTEATVQAIR